ncbi:MAG: signal recognition particle receptor subunit alpha, partial [Clostridia bacterium]|nr:signal recognition particle receptor subunit alpha [Clostridia bacterium]
MGFFDKLKAGLFKTKSAIVGKIDELMKKFVKIDEDLFDELEELLISADIGVNTTEEILDELREITRDKRLKDGADIKRELYAILRNMIGEHEPLNLSTKPSVILVIGVNGVGK